jgi:apolipoprotein N-acyltransferase
MINRISSLLKNPLVNSLIRYIMAIISALLMAAASPPYHFGWIAWFGLVPLFLAIQGSKRLQTYSIVVVWSFVLFACIIDFWLIRHASFLNLVFSGLGIILMSIAVSELQLITARFRRWGWVLFSGLVTGVLFLFPMIFGPTVFYNFANTQWLYPTMLQILPIVGEWGLVLLIILFNRGLVQVVLHRQRREWLMPAALIASLLVICVGWGTYRLSVDKPKASVGVVLMSINTNSGFAASINTDSYLQSLENKSSAQNGSTAPDVGIVAWSEAQVGDLVDTSNTATESSLAGEMGKYLVADFSESRAKGLPYNVAVVFGPDGSILAENQKRKIPAGEESAPGDTSIPWTVVNTPWGRMSTLVCRDTFYPGVARQAAKEGVDFFVVPANEFSTGYPRADALHLSETMLRAAENHTAIAFAYRTGTSALISDDGKLLTHKALASGITLNNIAVEGTLPVGVGGTLYTRIGDLFIWVILGVCIAGLVIGLFIPKIRKVK